MKALDLALRLEEIAHVVDVADVNVYSITADRHGLVKIHLDSPDDVDKVIALFDEPTPDYGEPYRIYSRGASFDEVVRVGAYSDRGDR